MLDNISEFARWKTALALYFILLSSIEPLFIFTITSMLLYISDRDSLTQLAFIFLYLFAIQRDWVDFTQNVYDFWNFSHIVIDRVIKIFHSALIREFQEFVENTLSLGKRAGRSEAARMRIVVGGGGASSPICRVYCNL